MSRAKKKESKTITIGAENIDYAKWFLDYGKESLKEDIKYFEKEFETFTKMLRKQVDEHKGGIWNLDIEEMEILDSDDPLIRELINVISKRVNVYFSNYANRLFQFHPECMSYSDEHPNGYFDFSEAYKLNSAEQKRIQSLLDNPNTSVEILKYEYNPDDSTYYPEHYSNNTEDKNDSEG